MPSWSIRPATSVGCCPVSQVACDLYLRMDIPKIPDEVWMYILIIVVMIKVSSMIRAVLPYEPGEPDLTDYGD